MLELDILLLDSKTKESVIVFDPIIHQSVRTQIVSLLSKNLEGLSFKEIQENLNLTQGNLSSHLKTLEDAGYIEIEKFFENKRPKTLCRLSKVGQEAFYNYLENLEKLIKGDL